MLAAEEATAGKFPGVGGTGWHGAQEARAIIESQALSMRFYAERLGLTNASMIEIRIQVIEKFCQLLVLIVFDSSERIIATGGASQNSSLLQVVANVFDASVFRTAFGSESAAFGIRIFSIRLACTFISNDG
jgi:glycerol kinase